MRSSLSFVGSPRSRITDSRSRIGKPRLESYLEDIADRDNEPVKTEESSSESMIPRGKVGEQQRGREKRTRDKSDD